jgi:hypothetical protein
MEYRIRDPGEPPIEFWDEEYGMVDYRGKVVMDIGADWGRTADYFLQKGARLVIAVEGREDRYSKLKDNAHLIGGIVPILLWITEPRDFAKFIKKYRPDVVQVDCEGCEEHLFEIPDALFSLVPEYLVETHNHPLFSAMKEKCVKNGYEIVNVKSSNGLKVVYARRRK